MNIRKTIEKFKVPIGIICGLAAIGAVIWGVSNMGTDHSKRFGKRVFVYNLDTGELVNIPSDDIYAPIDLEDGTGYTARVYSTTSCDDEESWRVAFLTQFTPRAKEQIATGDPEKIGAVLMNPANQIAATIEMAREGKWTGVMGLNSSETTRLYDEHGLSLKFCLP